MIDATYALLMLSCGIWFWEIEDVLRDIRKKGKPAMAI